MVILFVGFTGIQDILGIKILRNVEGYLFTI